VNNWISKYLISAICFLCSIFLLASNANASTKASARLESIRQIISELQPKATFSGNFAEGDLDGDGIKDVVYLVHTDKNDVILGVLRGQKSGHFFAWEISKPFVNAHHGFDLRIEKQAIFIHGFNGGRASGYEAHWQDQFQFRNDEFVMIGSESSDFAFFVAKDDSFTSGDGSSVSTNYLTRKIITTTIKNKKKSTRTEFLPAGTKLKRLRDYGAE
jgi:hypothetical protein